MKSNSDDGIDVVPNFDEMYVLVKFPAIMIKEVETIAKSEMSCYEPP